jgi:hypothetical protein
MLASNHILQRTEGQRRAAELFYGEGGSVS